MRQRSSLCGYSAKDAYHRKKLVRIAKNIILSNDLVPDRHKREVQIATHIILSNDLVPHRHNMVLKVWRMLHSDTQFGQTMVGVASKCCVPELGKECLENSLVDDSTSMWKVTDNGKYVEIRQTNKQQHFRNLSSKIGITFNHNDCKRNLSLIHI